MEPNKELLKQLQNRLNIVKKEIASVSKKTKELEKIQGSLCIHEKGKYIEYYHQVKPGKENRIYLSKDKIELAEMLANKAYYREALKRLEAERDKLNSIIETYSNYSIDNILESYKPSRQSLISQIVVTDDEYALKWQNKPYAGKPFRPDDTSTNYTAKEERVRSKSEINIANILNNHNIPYKYECPLFLEKSIYPNPIYPDFTVLNKRTRKVYYLEHLGKMDDSKYVSDNMPRLLNYERNGILLGDQLLLTHESLDNTLDTRIVEQMVKIFFT